MMVGMRSMIDLLDDRLGRAEVLGMHGLRERRTRDEIRKDMDQMIVLIQEARKLLQYGEVQEEKRRT